MRHKLISLRWKLMIIPSIFLTLNSVVSGIPLSMSYSNQENVKNKQFAQEKERSDRKVEDSSCMVNGSKYGEGEHISGAGPCEECICHPPNVTCSMMKCPINSGCITIQLPNKCCPKYKCDCEHKGKVYYNGEKINKSDESACRVCFCNGGEIVCTSIVCYTRNDCQGYYLPGECCPKYDNCSSNSEQKPRHKPIDSIDTKTLSGKNIDDWPHSTEYNHHEDSIWKRDTTEIQKEELLTIPNIVTTSPLFFDHEISKKINTTILNNIQENNSSMSNSAHATNFTGSEISSSREFLSGTTLSDFNINEDSKTFFLDFETNNLTTNKEITDLSLITQNETSEIAPFEELFDTTDIDNSVIITHENGSETIIDVTEVPVAPVIDEFIDPSSGTQVEIFNPKDLIMGNESSMNEPSTTASELDITTEVDDESREATTLRVLDKSKTDPPYTVIDSTQTKLEDDTSTENTFTDLEDTTDMFGPNYGRQPQDSTDDPQEQIINYKTTFLPTKLTTFESLSEITSEPPLIKLFDQPLTNSKIESIENSTSLNTDYNQHNITAVANKTNRIENDTIFLKLHTNNGTTCVNKNCTGHTHLNSKQSDSQTESSTLTTPFIIETKVLPNQASPPFFERKKLYPKEYPEEFETIQYGPSLTITKKTYTSIPDIIYTTTTMITLPTLDLIYKADKDIEKYLANQTTTTTSKPSNYLSPLRNVSST